MARNDRIYLHELITIVGTGSEAYKEHTGKLGGARIALRPAQAHSCLLECLEVRRRLRQRLEPAQPRCAIVLCSAAPAG